MNKIKGYAVAFLLGAFLFNAIPIMAQSIEVLFNSINISVNGVKVEADNILFEGTTYVPLRAIAVILDKEVSYDADTRTALINDKSVSAPAPTPVPIQQPTGQATTGQKNALNKAKLYIDIMAFSYTGLIEQLEHDKFSHDEAVYAADNCGADWFEQATIKGKAYLEIMAFSRDGLIDQLIHDGFTREQSEYGAKENGF